MQMDNLTPGERLALLKEKKGGLKEAQAEMISHTYIVYDEDGNIITKGLQKPDMRSYKKCKMYKFKTSDVKIIDTQGKSMAEFIIEEDEHDVCHIKLRTVETTKIKASRDFLSEITNTDDDYDVKFGFTKDDWVITIKEGTKVKQQMNFYVTPEKEPHILLERVAVPLEEFAKDNVVLLKRKNDIPEKFSIYTHKNFNKYSRN